MTVLEGSSRALLFGTRPHPSSLLYSIIPFGSYSQQGGPSVYIFDSKGTSTLRLLHI